MKIDLERVGARLEAVRSALNLGKGEFAKSFGVDPSSYSKIIKGEKPLLAESAFRISETWSIPMDFIYRGRLLGLPEEIADDLRRQSTDINK